MYIYFEKKNYFTDNHWRKMLLKQYIQIKFNQLLIFY
jgi:hypothetical protein